MEFWRNDRGDEGRVAVNGIMQAVERTAAGRVSFSMPLYSETDAQLEYGIEKISNLNLVDGAERTNQLVKFELRYRY